MRRGLLLLQLSPAGPFVIAARPGRAFFVSAEPVGIEIRLFFLKCAVSICRWRKKTKSVSFAPQMWRLSKLTDDPAPHTRESFLFSGGCLEPCFTDNEEITDGALQIISNNRCCMALGRGSSSQWIRFFFQNHDAGGANIFILTILRHICGAASSYYRELRHG